MAESRIIDLTEKQSLESGDYFVVDNETGGTKKISGNDAFSDYSKKDDVPNKFKFDFSDFCNNMDVDYEFDATTDANYTIIRIYKDRLDGNKQFPFVYAPTGGNSATKSTYDIAVEDGWFLSINAGIFNTSTGAADGVLVQNGVALKNSPSSTHSQCKPLVIDEDGNLSEATYDADAATLIANGAVSVVCGFMAIIKNYEAVPSSEWPDVSHFTQNAQRQIIGQFENGDYAIITSEGRNYAHSDGWTIAEAQQICIKHGLKFAYNLDGGGSTETMLGFKHFNQIYEGTTGRKVSDFIVFNGKNTFGVPEYMEEVKTRILIKYSVLYLSSSSQGFPINEPFIKRTGDRCCMLSATSNNASIDKYSNDNPPVLIAQDYACLIAIPQDANAVEVTTPGYKNAIQFYDDELHRSYDSGWLNIGTNTVKFTPGTETYKYMYALVKKSDDTPFPEDVDTSDWTLKFNRVF